MTRTLEEELLDSIVPEIIYGTAWKKDRTKTLTALALEQGFRAIDTANQAKHYSESEVGDALKEAVAHGVSRSSLFIQSKFTCVEGQDHRLPYEASARLGVQVAQSFESSLTHLKTEYLDSYLVHGPMSFPGLGDSDWEVWTAMETIHQSGRARRIGISNVNVLQLETLLQHAKVKPAFVQNRCYANRGWDADVRELCLEKEIVYQGFSLLTANTKAIHSPAVVSLASRLQATPEQLIFQFCRRIGILPLTGTSSAQHMQQDLKALGLPITESEVEEIYETTT